MTKINQILKKWPLGTTKTSTELEREGISAQDLQVYLKSKWVERYEKGIYKLHDDSVDWTGVLYGLQNKSKTTLHAGGRTALVLKGYAHYIKTSNVYLFSDRSENFNIWLKKLDNVIFRRNEIFDYSNDNYFSLYSVRDYEITISTLELAIMEMLYLVPQQESFEEAYLIMEGLSSLRPKLVTDLLLTTSSIKIKRLFMWMAEKANHSWVEKVNLSKVDFGRGKRVIVKNGSLNKKYNITVPKEYEE